jgi:DNA polymerase I-like protein with 3'-5' exonuclease and polymerase domains
MGSGGGVMRDFALNIVLKEFSTAIIISSFLIAHNMSFDEKVVGAEFLREKIESRLFTTDYAAQEFLIAAVLSEDQNMLAAYNSGDPYLYFAKMVNAIPPEGTKKSHKTTRDLYKQSCLAIQYGQGAASLSVKLNRPLATAQEIIRQHKRVFPNYWEWKENVSTQAKLNRQIQTRFGWKMHVVRDFTHKEDMTLGNFLMQSTGADILRIACYMLSEKGYQVIAPVHDAVLTEVNAETANQDISAIETLLADASEIVLGQRLRTETVTVRFPDRYMDERGKETWQKVERILSEIKAGTLKPEPEMLLELQQSVDIL